MRNEDCTLFQSLELLGAGKKRKKKTYTKPKKQKHKNKKVKLAVLKFYKVDGNSKITRLRKECPAKTCGSGEQAKLEEQKQSKFTCAIKFLRERTGMSIGLCKEALEATNWDMEGAMVYLRSVGEERAAEASRREAKEGIVAVHTPENGGFLSAVVLSCESDFVQRNQKFVNFAKSLATHAAFFLPADGEKCSLGRGIALNEMLQQTPPSSSLLVAAGRDPQRASGLKVADLLVDLTSQFREKISVSGVECMDSSVDCSVSAFYVHSELDECVGQAAGMVQMRFSPFNPALFFNATVGGVLRGFAKTLAVQVVATQPRFISVKDVPKSFIDHEREILQRVLEHKRAAAARAAAAAAAGASLAEAAPAEAANLRSRSAEAEAANDLDSAIAAEVAEAAASLEQTAAAAAGAGAAADKKACEKAAEAAVERCVKRWVRKRCLLTQEYLLANQLNALLSEASSKGEIVQAAAKRTPEFAMEYATVADALEFLACLLNCELEVTQMRFLGVGRR
ncbi:hypothetical protein Efla_005867 [Eimeria flavescens]